MPFPRPLLRFFFFLLNQFFKDDSQLTCLSGCRPGARRRRRISGAGEEAPAPGSVLAITKGNRWKQKMEISYSLPGRAHALQLPRPRWIHAHALSKLFGSETQCSTKWSKTGVVVVRTHLKQFAQVPAGARSRDLLPMKKRRKKKRKRVQYQSGDAALIWKPSSFNLELNWESGGCKNSAGSEHTSLKCGSQIFFFFF